MGFVPAVGLTDPSFDQVPVHSPGQCSSWDTDEQPGGSGIFRSNKQPPDPERGYGEPGTTRIELLDQFFMI